jgi:hypothetical protein
MQNREGPLRRVGTADGFLIGLTTMAMDKVDWQIHTRLMNQWDAFKLHISRLHPEVKLITSSATPPLKMVAPSDEMRSTFRCEPTVIPLPERAGRVSIALYLVFRGEMTFDRAHFMGTEGSELRTLGFRSEAAYFRRKQNPDQLRHIYGAHYDLEMNAMGHPKFHAQHKSFSDFSAQIDDHLGVPLPVTDCMVEVLSSVRLPCAQMDFFAILLQAVADRLVSTTSSQRDLDTFEELLRISKGIHGCGYMNPAFQNAEAMTCYRSPHWYN